MARQVRSLHISCYQVSLHLVYLLSFSFFESIVAFMLPSRVFGMTFSLPFSSFFALFVTTFALLYIFF